ncbi:hypothetical protein [Acinetobacter calcoaceticus]|uniref:hypothetical protein n=1 Tax=Acinetobacter calcoaceticus TaxID=471 RepID=UPI0002CEDC6C|nr:hypothetical protein [Acinetobacter calcoaceticus]ENU08447.1 hypothetical protein F997_01891 [Acinetobacter calcoaceticus NIPH 13]
MLENLILIVFLGVTIGWVVGLCYEKVFILTYEGMEKFFFKIFSINIFFKLISLLFSCVITLLFFLIGMLFLPVIPDALWNNFYISFFMGIVVGVAMKGVVFKNK